MVELVEITPIISVLRETNKYVRCLLTYFIIAFESVDDVILIRKLAEYGLGQNAIV